jgi:hypothetical protein
MYVLFRPLSLHVKLHTTVSRPRNFISNTLRSNGTGDRNGVAPFRGCEVRNIEGYRTALSFSSFQIKRASESRQRAMKVIFVRRRGRSPRWYSVSGHSRICQACAAVTIMSHGKIAIARYDIKIVPSVLGSRSLTCCSAPRSSRRWGRGWECSR